MAEYFPGYFVDFKLDLQISFNLLVQTCKVLMLDSNSYFRSFLLKVRGVLLIPFDQITQPFM